MVNLSTKSSRSMLFKMSGEDGSEEEEGEKNETPQTTYATSQSSQLGASTSPELDSSITEPDGPVNNTSQSDCGSSRVSNEPSSSNGSSSSTAGSLSEATDFPPLHPQSHETSPTATSLALSHFAGQSFNTFASSSSSLYLIPASIIASSATLDLKLLSENSSNHILKLPPLDYRFEMHPNPSPPLPPVLSTQPKILTSTLGSLSFSQDLLALLAGTRMAHKVGKVLGGKARFVLVRRGQREDWEVLRDWEDWEEEERWTGLIGRNGFHGGCWRWMG